MDERETISDSPPKRRDHALGEEVAGDECVHVDPNELLPHRLFGAPAAGRRWCQPLVLQNPANGRSPNPQPEFAQLADDTAIAPASVLLGQAENEFTKVPSDLRPANASWLAPFP